MRSQSQIARPINRCRRRLLTLCGAHRLCANSTNKSRTGSARAVGQVQAADRILSQNTGPSPVPSRGQNRTGWVQIVGQVQASDRDSQSNADPSRALSGQPCETRVTLAAPSRTPLLGTVALVRRQGELPYRVIKMGVCNAVGFIDPNLGHGMKDFLQADADRPHAEPEGGHDH
jgi:hypothetical protein